MGKTFAGATMSLDGFIAGPNDTGFDLLFKWYNAGDVEVPMPDSTAQVPDSHVSAATAALMRKEQAGWGALVVGRNHPASVDAVHRNSRRAEMKAVGRPRRHQRNDLLLLAKQRLHGCKIGPGHVGTKR